MKTSAITILTIMKKLDAMMMSPPTITNPRHSYSTSSSSLRDSSGSYQPMLSNRPRKQPYSFYFYRVPHKTARYLCLILATAILLFVLHLFRMAWISAKQVELGKPAEKVEQQAPTWENFEFLRRYYGGVRTLISKEKNVPEYPSDRSMPGGKRDVRNISK